MKKNFLIGQISDIHYVSSKERLFDKIDTHNSFLRIIDACNNLDQIPDIYILSGDLIHDIEIYYHEFFNLCKKLNRPIYPMMGNHDVRSGLKKHLSNNLIDEKGNVNYCIDSFNTKIICLDTAIENKIEGEINESSMEWLEKILDQENKKKIIIFMHHPPIKIGSLLFDHIKCKNGIELINLISKYKNVKEVVFGHVHCSYRTKINNIIFSSCPSATIQYPIQAKESSELIEKNFIRLFDCEEIVINSRIIEV